MLIVKIFSMIKIINVCRVQVNIITWDCFGLKTSWIWSTPWDITHRDVVFGYHRHHKKVCHNKTIFFVMLHVFKMYFLLFLLWSTGTMTKLNYNPFAGTIQVMKAVGNHMVLTFCQSMPGSQLFSVVVSRSPNSLSVDVSYWSNTFWSMKYFTRKYEMNFMIICRICKAFGHCYTVEDCRPHQLGASATERLTH